MRILLSILCLSFLYTSCVNDMKEVDELMQDVDAIYMDTARQVRILYSDSAQVQVEIEAPTLVRHLSKEDPRDEFPDGVYVKFYNENKKVSSWLKADYAVKLENQDIIIARYNVQLYNANQEKLESPELIWNEKEEIMYTDKIVRITKPMSGDTTYGSGFETNQDFSRFEIKQNYTARMNSEEFSKTLDEDDTSPSPKP